MIVRGGTVVTARGVEVADIEVADGRITAVGPDLDETADEIDASGLHVFPGGIDSHVHFNEPGRTEWETIADGSAALAAGGYTCFVDMPLNSLPVTVDAAAFDLKLEAATRSSAVDFGLWGGLVPGNLDVLEELAQRGVMGFKAFMCPSGIDEFPACDTATLGEGMARIAELDSILLVHAEDPTRLGSPAGNSARDFIWSRPADAELEAISQAIELARRTGCPLHIVHVSTGRGAELIQEAQERGVDVSGETCPHYLLYVEDDMERMGGIAKCAPPFRTALDRERLGWMLRDRRLPMVVSDHSPSTLALKQDDDFLKVWGGISGCQSTRQLLLANDDLDLQLIAAVTATNVAGRFGLAGKGDIAPGFDADLWIADLGHEDTLRRKDLLYRNPFSAHEGQRIRGRTVKTLVRGGEPESGRFIRPAARS
ncbi:MAG TPA: allantoinase AllB [Candidatus Nitrosopolaris sp.]|nr:allantoinase AllB [Candidatus Nitrosopolaris sp.]